MTRWKKVAVCVFVFSLMGGSFLFADTVTQKIRVWSNGKEIADGGYVIDGKTFISAREAGGIVSLDGSGKVSILRPNVHIVLFKGDTVFGNVKLGKLKFKVLSQVDSLTDSVSSVKIAITDPSGNVKDIDTRDMEGAKMADFWFPTSEFTYDFKESGKYKVGFYIKATKGSDYVLVSEKVITTMN
ncbi:copper amine oxidase [Paenibacillus donghaensis]|uniref:Copper amine oxidase n=1 Tax=Paenibacillus donghaensis TaxID=414771 RepID=A0A2Z2K7H3_9BACL|nr:copper amine oxidase [Paenibacillus donghaensis]ASA20997.1 copper amine oxidase [Paenibacillus donghaensis]